MKKCSLVSNNYTTLDVVQLHESLVTCCNMQQDTLVDSFIGLNYHDFREG